MASKEIDPKYRVDPKKATKEELEEAFALLSKKRERIAKIKSGELKGYTGLPYSALSEEQKAKLRKANQRRLVRQSLIIAKATAAGIVVSDKEVDAAIAAKKGK